MSCDAASARHLLTVWNPSYSGDALDAHLSVLLRWAERHARGEAHEDDVYVWWGKIRSKNREGHVPHHDEIVALDAQTQAKVETHLYLTDYRSLYVAHVAEITDEDVRRDAGEAEHMPAYYEGHAVDFWFRLFDVRRLITGDTLEVIEELKNLRNTHYHGRPVSLYGGIVDLPLVVTREPEVAWFSDTAALNEGRLWAERAAEQRSETERMSRELRDNLFGRDLWPRLEHGTRAFLAAAEATFRAYRDDPGRDLSGPAVSYAKAVETELNALVFPAVRRVLAKRPPHEREVREDGRLLDLGGRVPHQSLGTIQRLLEHTGAVQVALRKAAPHDQSWILGMLPRELAPVIELRNAGAHAQVTSAERLEPVRRSILGIGCSGLIERLARARIRCG
ncbi:MAG TPA: hypothetical protein VFQ22_11545 [Longimicrobiales bacterium]|nr:hypothetical protein [Longimicrobiales bacterium]